MQFTEHVAWITSPPIYYSLGLDGISLPLVLMTVGIMPLCVLASWNAITTRVRSFMADAARYGNGHGGGLHRAGLCPVLRILGSHADSDVPPHRRLGRAQPTYAAIKFFLYTLAGSLLCSWSPSSSCTFMEGTPSTSSP